jgi:hypothetical protein
VLSLGRERQQQPDARGVDEPDLTEVKLHRLGAGLDVRSRALLEAWHGRNVQLTAGMNAHMSTFALSTYLEDLHGLFLGPVKAGTKRPQGLGASVPVLGNSR